MHNACKRFTQDQQAVIDLARESKQGLGRKEANILVEFAQEYGINNHGPQIHSSQSGIWSYTEHIKVFNVHIKIIGE